MEMNEKFNESIKLAIGETCWNAELTVGSTLMLDFGKQLSYDPPMVNPNSGETVRIGEYNFLIFCSWRLENRENVICTWQDKFYNYQKLEEMVKMIRCRKIENIYIDKPSYDVIIVFDEGLVLKVFCDLQSVNDPKKSNYYFSTFNDLFAIKCNSELLCKEQDVKRVYV